MLITFLSIQSWYSMRFAVIPVPHLKKNTQNELCFDWHQRSVGFPDRIIASRGLDQQNPFQ